MIIILSRCNPAIIHNFADYRVHQSHVILALVSDLLPYLLPAHSLLAFESLAHPTKHSTLHLFLIVNLGLLLLGWSLLSGISGHESSLGTASHVHGEFTGL